MNQLASFEAMGLPQLHAPDYYVRLTERKMSSIRLQHSVSMRDDSVLVDARNQCTPGRKAGITEWHGVQDGYHVSFGWDWTQLEDGDIRPLKLVAPRTNVKLIDEKGYDLPDESSTARMWDFISSLAWQRQVEWSFEDSDLPSTDSTC